MMSGGTVLSSGWHKFYKSKVLYRKHFVVIFIPGVGDLYTDPQIHTADGKEYGEANLGPRGMALFFSSHQCNK